MSALEILKVIYWICNESTDCIEDCPFCTEKTMVDSEPKCPFIYGFSCEPPNTWELKETIKVKVE